MSSRLNCLSTGLVLTLSLFGCENPTGTFEPREVSGGVIRIETVTTGLEPAPSFRGNASARLAADAYAVSLDGEITREIGHNDALEIGNLNSGEHLVELTDVPKGCSVEGDNPRRVMLGESQNARVTFRVDCSLIPR